MRLLLLTIFGLTLLSGPLPALEQNLGRKSIDGYRELLKVNQDPTKTVPLPSATWPKPGYPLAARKNREECAAILRVFYGTNGRAERVQIESLVGSRRLAQLTADLALAKWEISQVVVAGRPTKVFHDTPIVFILEEGYGTLARRLAEARRGERTQVQAIRALAKAEIPAKR